MALRDACSPSNMVAAAAPGEVLTKMEVCGVVRRKVDAKPEPPWEAIWVVGPSRERARRMEGSIEGAMVVDLIANQYSIVLSDKGRLLLRS